MIAVFVFIIALMVLKTNLLVLIKFRQSFHGSICISKMSAAYVIVSQTTLFLKYKYLYELFYYLC